MWDNIKRDQIEDIFLNARLTRNKRNRRDRSFDIWYGHLPTLKPQKSDGKRTKKVGKNWFKVFSIERNELISREL